VANTFWWYAMNTDADYTVTPRPLYCADGRKLPDCYSFPLDLRARFTSDFGPFPSSSSGGRPPRSLPASGSPGRPWPSKSSSGRACNWSTCRTWTTACRNWDHDGDIAQDLAEIDALCGRLLDFFEERHCRVVILSEYGITPVSRPIHPNRILREAGLISLKVDLGRETLDPGSSRAFAVADHQLCHVYVRDRKDIARVRELFTGLPGVEQVLDDAGKRAHGLDHERSGELVLLAAADSWFTYYWWLADDDGAGLCPDGEYPRQAGLRPVRTVPRSGDRLSPAEDRHDAGQEDCWASAI
jgi:hypothetical protein